MLDPLIGLAFALLAMTTAAWLLATLTDHRTSAGPLVDRFATFLGIPADDDEKD